MLGRVTTCQLLARHGRNLIRLPPCSHTTPHLPPCVQTTPHPTHSIILTKASTRFYSLVSHTHSLIKANPLHVLQVTDLEPWLPTLAAVTRQPTSGPVLEYILGLKLETELVSLMSSRQSYWIWDKTSGYSMRNEVVVGRFSPVDKSSILSNWQQLCTMFGILGQEQEKEFLRCIVFPCSGEDKSELYVKSSLLGIYLKKDLNKLRLCADVVQKTKFWLCNNGAFTTAEDNIIVNFVRRNGEKWTQLAQLLEREYDYIETTLKRRHGKLVSTQSKGRRGKYSLDEDKYILGSILKSQGEERLKTDTCKLTLKHYQEIGKPIGRPYDSVCRRWHVAIKPVLTKHYAGTAASPDDQDFRCRLLEHLLARGYKYRTEVDWNLLAREGRFKGETAGSLSKVIIDMTIYMASCQGSKTGEINNIYNKLTLAELLDFFLRHPEKFSVMRHLGYESQLLEYYTQLLSSEKKAREELLTSEPKPEIAGS